jgi:hypothetical protein
LDGGGDLRGLKTVISMAMLLAACGGGTVATTAATSPISTTLPNRQTTTPETTTTAIATTTTEAPTTTTSAARESDAIVGIPQQCVDAMVVYLKAIESEVTAFDFETFTIEDYQNFSIATLPAAQALSEAINTTECVADTGNGGPERLEALLAIAEREAPGSLPWLEIQRDASELPVTGTCGPDVTTLEHYVAAGGTAAELSPTERWHSFLLAVLINTWCPLEVGPAFLSRDDVETFLGLPDT